MKAQRYQILIGDSIHESWSAYFSEMSIVPDPTCMTRLCGDVADQSALHGVLSKIRDLNLKLISVQLLDDDAVTPVECRQCWKNNPLAGRNKPSNTPFGS